MLKISQYLEAVQGNIDNGNESSDSDFENDEIKDNFDNNNSAKEDNYNNSNNSSKNSNYEGNFISCFIFIFFIFHCFLFY